MEHRFYSPEFWKLPWHNDTFPLRGQQIKSHLSCVLPFVCQIHYSESKPVLSRIAQRSGNWTLTQSPRQCQKDSWSDCVMPLRRHDHDRRRQQLMIFFGLIGKDMVSLMHCECGMPRWRHNDLWALQFTNQVWRSLRWVHSFNMKEIWSSGCGEKGHKRVNQSEAGIMWKVTGAWRCTDKVWGLLRWVHSSNMKAIWWVVAEIKAGKVSRNQKPASVFAKNFCGHSPFGLLGSLNQ